MIKNWVSKNKKRIGDFKIFTIDSIQRESLSSGVSGEFFLVNSPDWMMIIPLLKDEKGRDCFLMVKQYRHGSDSITLEFPAGMVDPGEDVMDTAIRELSEETGYKSRDIREVGSINPNPAFMTNRTTTFVARDIIKTGDQKLDKHEEIETVIVPVEEFDRMIGQSIDSNCMINSAITIQAYFFYLRSLSPDVLNLGKGSEIN